MKKNLISGLFFVGFGVWIWFYTGTFPSLPEGYPGPALFPKVIAIGLMLSGLALIITQFTKKDVSDTDTAPTSPLGWSGPVRMLVGITLVLCYPLLQGWIGFVPTLSLLSIIIAVLLGARFIVAVPTAVISSLLIYWLFTGLLGVPL